MSPFVYLLVFALSTGITLALTPVAIRLGKRWDLVALPGGRRKHAGRLVRIGGLALYPAFLVATLATLGLPRSDPLELTRLTGVLLGMGLVWAFGLLDDRFDLSKWNQIAALVLAALVAVAFKVFIEVFNNPFADEQMQVGWYLMLPLTILWLAGMSGTVNMLDGLDGLATGVTALAALVLFVHMLRLGQFSVSLLPLALVGCCLGFLPYNLNPALGVLSIVAGAKVASALLVVWVPIVDVAWQIYARWRRGQAITLGDRGHLHFRLLDLGWPQNRIVLLYCAITAILGAVALLVSSRLLKLVVLVVVGLAIMGALAALTRIGGDHTEAGR